MRRVVEILGFEYRNAIFGSVDIQYANKYGKERYIINNKTPRIAFDELCPFGSS